MSVPSSGLPHFNLAQMPPKPVATNEASSLIAKQRTNSTGLPFASYVEAKEYVAKYAVGLPNYRMLRIRGYLARLGRLSRCRNLKNSKQTERDAKFADIGHKMVDCIKQRDQIPSPEMKPKPIPKQPHQQQQQPQQQQQQQPQQSQQQPQQQQQFQQFPNKLSNNNNAASNSASQPASTSIAALKSSNALPPLNMVSASNAGRSKPL